MRALSRNTNVSSHYTFICQNNLGRMIWISSIKFLNLKTEVYLIMEKNLKLGSSEALVVSILMMVIMVLLILPFFFILFLKFLYTTYAAFKEEVKIPEKISYKLERIY